MGHSTDKSPKSNIMTKTNKNPKMNSLPLRKFYEVLRIDENHYVENQSEEIIETTIIFERNNKKMHKGTNSRFVDKVSGEWFFKAMRSIKIQR